MIIDRILDRKDGTPYSAKRFYNYCMDWNDLAEEITRAMDCGTNEQVRAALCRYILEQDYNPDICEYVNGQNWLEDDKINPMCETCKRFTRMERQTIHDCYGTTSMVWTGCAGKIE